MRQIVGIDADNKLLVCTNIQGCTAGVNLTEVYGELNDEDKKQFLEALGVKTDNYLEDVKTILDSTILENRELQKKIDWYETRLELLCKVIDDTMERKNPIDRAIEKGDYYIVPDYVENTDRVTDKDWSWESYND